MNNAMLPQTVDSSFSVACSSDFQFKSAMFGAPTICVATDPCSVC